MLPDPQRAGVIFAGTSAGLYRSDDYGDHWSAYSAGLPTSNAAVALAATPDDATLLAGLDHGGVYRSANDGATWVASNGGLPAQATSAALAWDAANHTWLLGLINGSGAPLFISGDGGQTWAPHATGLPAKTQVNALATLGGPSAPLFAATTDGLFSSADAGQSWSHVGGGLPQGTALALATLTQQPTWLYVSIANAVYRSTDSGAQWALVAPGLTNPAQGLAVTEGKQSGPVVYAAVGQLARYPTGITSGSGSGLSSNALLVVIVLVLIGGGYALSRRTRRFGYAMGAQRNESNTGRSADEAARWNRMQAERAAAAERQTGDGPPRGVSGAPRADDTQPSEGRVIAPSELTSRATTGASADEGKAAQNGHGKPKQRG